MVNIKNSSANVVLILVFLSIVNGLIPQLEIAVLGDMKISTVIIKFLMIFALIIPLFYFNRINGSVVRLCYLFVLYLAAEIFYFVSMGHSASDVITGYNAYYFIIAILPIFFCVNKTIEYNKIKTLFLVSSIPLSILGIFQYVQGNPILPVSSVNGFFNVSSYQYIVNGSIRAFSLFDSGLAFGDFLCICLSIILAYMLLVKKHRLLYFILLALISITVYMTLTRNVYFAYLLTVLSTIVISKMNKNNFFAIKLMPIIYLILGLIINASAQMLVKVMGSSMINADTLTIRQISWNLAMQQWTNNGLSFLFGTGLYQNANASNQVMIDNSYLAILINIGVIGFILWVSVLLLCWNIMLKRLVSEFNYFNVALVSFYSSIFMTNMFNINYGIYLLAFVLMVISKEPQLERKKIGKRFKIVWSK